MSHVFLLFAAIGAIVAGAVTPAAIEEDSTRRVLTLVEDHEDDAPRVLRLRTDDRGDAGDTKHESLRITVRADGSGPAEIEIIGPDGPMDLEDLEDLDLKIFGLGPDGLFGPKGLIDLEDLEDLHLDFDFEAFTDGDFDVDMDFDWDDIRDRMPKLFRGKHGGNSFQFESDGDDGEHIFGFGPDGAFRFDMDRFFNGEHGLRGFKFDGHNAFEFDIDEFMEGMPDLFRKGGANPFALRKDDDRGAGRPNIRFFDGNGNNQQFRIRTDGANAFVVETPRDDDTDADETHRDDARPRGTAELHQRIDRLERKLERIMEMLERLER